jgi:hypothetical protein
MSRGNKRRTAAQAQVRLLLIYRKVTRITPTDILEYLAGGMTEDQILKDFPSLTRDHIRAVLAYAAERERRYATHSALRHHDR